MILGPALIVFYQLTRYAVVVGDVPYLANEVRQDLVSGAMNDGGPTHSLPRLMWGAWYRFVVWIGLAPGADDSSPTELLEAITRWNGVFNTLVTAATVVIFVVVLRRTGVDRWLAFAAGCLAAVAAPVWLYAATAESVALRDLGVVVALGCAVAIRPLSPPRVAVWLAVTGLATGWMVAIHLASIWLVPVIAIAVLGNRIVTRPPHCPRRSLLDFAAMEVPVLASWAAIALTSFVVLSGYTPTDVQTTLEWFRSQWDLARGGQVVDVFWTTTGPKYAAAVLGMLSMFGGWYAAVPTASDLSGTLSGFADVGVASVGAAMLSACVVLAGLACAGLIAARASRLSSQVGPRVLLLGIAAACWLGINIVKLIGTTQGDLIEWWSDSAFAVSALLAVGVTTASVSPRVARLGVGGLVAAVLAAGVAAGMSDPRVGTLTRPGYYGEGGMLSSWEQQTRAMLDRDRALFSLARATSAEDVLVGYVAGDAYSLRQVSESYPSLARTVTFVGAPGPPLSVLLAHRITGDRRILVEKALLDEPASSLTIRERRDRAWLTQRYPVRRGHVGTDPVRFVELRATRH